MRQSKHHFQPVKDDDDSAERALWIAVLRRAVKDLQKPKTRDSAMKFFTDRDGMFQWICEILGVEAEIIRRGILDIPSREKIDSSSKNAHSATRLNEMDDVPIVETAEDLPGAGEPVPYRQVPTSRLSRPRHYYKCEVNNGKRGQQIWKTKLANSKIRYDSTLKRRQ